MTSPETDATEPQPRHDPDSEPPATSRPGTDGRRSQAQEHDQVRTRGDAAGAATHEPEQPLGRPGDRLRVRRSVNFPAFLLTGAFVGFLLGGLIDFLGPTALDPRSGAAVYTATSAFSTLAVMFALVGTLVGAVVALFFDRRG